MRFSYRLITICLTLNSTIMIRYYRTLKGLLKAYGMQVTVEKFFDENQRIYRNGKNIRLQPTKELQFEVATAFAKQLYKRKSSSENFIARLTSESCLLDWSLFQCFYVELSNGKIRISNSLSGEAHDYCIRKFLRSR